MCRGSLSVRPPQTYHKTGRFYGPWVLRHQPQSGRDAPHRHETQRRSQIAKIRGWRSLRSSESRPAASARISIRRTTAS